MKAAVLVTPLALRVPVIEDALYIGIDSGAARMTEQSIKPDYAVGDFDSIKPEELEKLKSECKVIEYPVKKDETDTQLALQLADEKGCDLIILCGGLGGRIDHALANLSLMIYDFKNMLILDEKQCAFMLESGDHVVHKYFRHVSFFPLEETMAALSGFEYPMDMRMIRPGEIFTVSNSFKENETARVRILKGRLLCLQSDYR